MFGNSNNKKWLEETLPVINGNSPSLDVTINRFPVRKRVGESYWHYRYSNFGNDFITELSDRQLKDFDSFSQLLNAGKIIKVPVKVKELPIIEVEIHGSASSGTRTFYSDLADAIIDAMEKNKIRP